MAKSRVQGCKERHSARDGKVPLCRKDKGAAALGQAGATRRLGHTTKKGEQGHRQRKRKRKGGEEP